KYPPLLDFLNGQASVFHPNVLEGRRLRDGALKPGQKKSGLIFFMRPSGSNAAPFNGVMWLETPHGKQAFTTKAISVKAAAEPSVLQRFATIWQKVVGGALPYNKSYALLIGI